MKKLFIILMLIISIFCINNYNITAETNNDLVIEFKNDKPSNEELIYLNYIYRIMIDKGIIQKDNGIIKNASDKILVTYDYENGVLVIPQDVGESDTITYHVEKNECNMYESVNEKCSIIYNFDNIIFKFGGNYDKPISNLELYDSKSYARTLTIRNKELLVELESNGIITTGMNDGKEYIYDSNGKVLFIYDIKTGVTIPTNVTTDDNIHLSFTNDITNKKEDFNILFVKEEKSDKGSIYIKSVDVVDKSKNTKITYNPFITGLTFNSYESFVVPGDYVKYKLIIQNDSNEDYELEIPTVSNEYIKYTIETDNKLKKNSDSIVYLNVKYDNEVPQNLFNDLDYQSNLEYPYNLEYPDNLDYPLLSTYNIKKATILGLTPSIENPKTGIINISAILSALLLVGIISYNTLKNTKFTMAMILIFSVFSLSIVSATSKINLNLNINSIINGGITYQGYNILDLEKMDESILQKVKMDIEEYGYSEDIRIFKNDNIDFKITSDYTADVQLRVFLYNTEPTYLETSISIEPDTETGSSKVVVGECFLSSTNEEFEEYYCMSDKMNYECASIYANYEVCPRLLRMLQSLDAEVVKKIINNNK